MARHKYLHDLCFFKRKPLCNTNFSWKHTKKAVSQLLALREVIKQGLSCAFQPNQAAASPESK